MEPFIEHLKQQNVQDEQIQSFLKQLEEFKLFLEKKSIDIESIPKSMILEYTESMVESSKEKVLDYIRAMYSFANFIKKYDYIVELIDIVEAYNAIDNLYLRVAEKHGEEIRDEIFQDIEIPPLGVDPDVKPKTTEIVMSRLENSLGEEKTIELLAPCLHGRPIEPIKKDREDFLKIGDIDEFLKVKKQEFVQRLEKHAQEGTLEYAQFINDDVVKYVKDSETITPGIRDGTKIIVTKIPYQMESFLNTDDNRIKRYYSCYCAWVRGAIKKGEEKNISPNFCHCSAGFFKQYWDIIFDQSVKVEPIETPITGAFECKFAVHIPEEFL
ncbi:MAG: hypothetical protein ACTSQF_04755 [Candidatus Heimdallarchaeaceae archaeon]